jgi:nitroreductase
MNKNKRLINIRVVTGLLIVICMTGIIAFAEELKPIELSAPQMERGKLLMQALKERQSNRDFSDKELPLDVISNLLWAASGVNRPDSGKLTAPTTKNWQEIDIYVAMQKGLYLYNRKKHILEPVVADDIRKFTGLQGFTARAPLDLIYVADCSKADGDEKDREYYSGVDTGFVSQNVYLFCASEGLATVILGSIDKLALTKVMNLRKDQKIILTQPVGYPGTK